MKPARVECLYKCFWNEGEVCCYYFMLINAKMPLEWTEPT